MVKFAVALIVIGFVILLVSVVWLLDLLAEFDDDEVKFWR